MAVHSKEHPESKKWNKENMAKLSDICVLGVVDTYTHEPKS